MLRLLLLICFLPLAVPAALPELTEAITSCLTKNSIANFTTYPVTENDSFAYYNILNFSIINLRFADPTSPKPIVIVLPKNLDELTNTVLCSRKASLDIRARCGGHSYEGTSSVATDGAPFLIIDLMNLSRLSVDLTSETAWVQGGATLGETYKAIAEASSAHGFSAGSCPTVGAGGHISGGGFGLLSRKYGLAADNVIDALLVDAEGRLLDREAMGEDVFWAIRGGGGGVFGIVYAWKIQLLKVPPIVSAFIVHRTENRTHVAKLLHKWQNVAHKLADEFYLSVFVGANLTGSGTSDISATFKGFYLGPRSKAVSMLSQAFPELSISEEDCNEMSWIESVVYFSGLPDGTSVADLGNRCLKDRSYFKAKADYVREPISYNGILTALDILEKEPKGYVILDPYGGIMDKISSEALAFPHRKGNLFTIQYLVEWQRTDDQNRDNYLEWIRGFYDAMTPYVSNGPRAAYINYLDHDLGVKQLIRGYTPFKEDAVEEARSWGEKYFLQNYDRLVKAKTIIDPDNVFNSEQGIPPMSASEVSSDIERTSGSMMLLHEHDEIEKEE